MKIAESDREKFKRIREEPADPAQDLFSLCLQRGNGAVSDITAVIQQVTVRSRSAKRHPLSAGFNWALTY